MFDVTGVVSAAVLIIIMTLFRAAHLFVHALIRIYSAFGSFSETPSSEVGITTRSGEENERTFALFEQFIL